MVMIWRLIVTVFFVSGLWAEANDGGLISFAVTEFTRAAGPRAVVVGPTGPVRAFIGTGVEILPDGAGGDEREWERDGDGTGVVLYECVMKWEQTDKGHVEVEQAVVERWKNGKIAHIRFYGNYEPGPLED